MSYKNALVAFALTFGMLATAFLPNDAAAWPTVTADESPSPGDSSGSTVNSGEVSSFIGVVVEALGDFPAKEVSDECTEQDDSDCPGDGLTPGFEVNGPDASALAAVTVQITPASKGKVKTPPTISSGIADTFSRFRANHKLWLFGTENSDGLYTIESVTPDGSSLTTVEDFLEAEEGMFNVAPADVKIVVDGTGNCLWYSGDINDEDANPDLDQTGECELHKVYPSVLRMWLNEERTAAIYIATQDDGMWGYLAISPGSTIDACNAINATYCVQGYWGGASRGPDGCGFPTIAETPNVIFYLPVNDLGFGQQIEHFVASDELFSVTALPVSMDAVAAQDYLCPKTGPKEGLANAVLINEVDRCRIEGNPNTFKQGATGGDFGYDVFNEAASPGVTCPFDDLNPAKFTLEGVSSVCSLVEGGTLTPTPTIA